jgi:glycosyltransferase involved in cell wall biosynthesis
MASLSEGIPCAMLEAMACKRVVVVPSTGDIIDVVKHGYNGFIHNNTFGDIVKWMKYALENYSSLEKLRQNARQTIIDEHSYQVAIKRWDKLFGELLEI